MKKKHPIAGTVYVPTDVTHRHRLLMIVLSPLLLVVLGTLGYWSIEGYHPFDALYMSVITLSTIGYSEVHELSTKGRIFTIFLVFGGVFTLFYATSEILRFIISGEIQTILGRQRMERSLSQLHGHFVVCGFGRMGKLVCQEFSRQQEQFVVIDADDALLAEFDMPFGIALLGDATSDDVLKHAGIERARALVAVLADDADNLYTSMSARLLNKKIYIVARAEDAQSEVKLKRAGANRVVTPYEIGGQRLAQAVLRPAVVDFIELASHREHVELQLEEVRVHAGSPLDGSNLHDSRIGAEMKVIIVAIKKQSGKMLFNPDPEMKIEPADTLIAIGPREQLDKLELLAKK